MSAARKLLLSLFTKVWLVDFEFNAPAGHQPDPVCLVAHDLGTGDTTRLWQDELRRAPAPPYGVGPDTLVVAYYASAEMECHLALGWPLPEHLLDCYTEFRRHTNGLPTPCGRGLLGALAYYGIPGIESVEKESMRQLALRGGPWTADEQTALLAYCESDVVALRNLLDSMAPDLDVFRALVRGRYMKAAARMQSTGVPVDTDLLAALRNRWDAIKLNLVAKIDADYNVFDGTSFKAERWAAWLNYHGIPWPVLPSGNLALDDATFREMARIHPEVAPIRELRWSLAQMRLADVAVGPDSRNRCLLSAFGTRSGRNAPSNSSSVFGTAVWLRGLIRPEAGFGLAYLDWSQQEFGIAAALSGDSNMMAAYASGDPYLSFGKQAGAIPPDGTKKSHGALRDQFKSCVLAVQYGMGAETLATRTGLSVARARELLELHRRTYPDYWRWSDGALDYAMTNGQLHTVFGWVVHVGDNVNPRSLRNFPMQANGAEMLRLACCMLTEQGIRVCMPVHDAVLIEAPLPDLEATIATAQEVMADASSIVLGGFRLRSDAKVIRYPERYEDERGRWMWQTVMALLPETRSQTP